MPPQMLAAHTYWIYWTELLYLLDLLELALDLHTTPTHHFVHQPGHHHCNHAQLSGHPVRAALAGQAVPDRKEVWNYLKKCGSTGKGGGVAALMSNHHDEDMHAKSRIMTDGPSPPMMTEGTSPPMMTEVGRPVPAHDDGRRAPSSPMMTIGMSPTPHMMECKSPPRRP